MSARGVTLLETMVALVILGAVVVGYLDLLAGALRLGADARVWSQAVAYAEDGMEQVKLASTRSRGLTVGPERLAGGYERRTEIQPWGDGLERITVILTLPGGGRYALERLVRSP
jgi:prepilin-type N-terminal cleavage/methylation domain-containing protein